ncbi:LysM-like peptidoglycan-binding domain-containing protein [Vibrio sp. SCSIO 43136]|uniref:LysM-like peptidoglycan-binding domain-containing protein n=1 Tax=Vibrio sp. SCSIO 43136 TaxID=2819101 RepID=UPI002076206D|nr:LysM-like peptidoglycan-binding domain-containing protein [Vibrio sp. SCSIO 43136]USD65565.1 lysine transporter LysM [Vibrio sp. SCSIO 43136]
MNRRQRKKRTESFGDKLQRQWQDLDFKQALSQLKSYRDRLPKLHQRIIAAIAVVVVVLLLLPSPTSLPEMSNSEQGEESRKTVELNTTGLSEQKNDRVAAPKEIPWKEYTVKSGDTLAKVFRTNGLPMSDLNALARIEGSDKPLSQIKKGQLVRYKLTNNGELDIIQVEKQGGAVMFFRLSDGGFGRSK